MAEEKIFGVGLSRTGTTSLTAALRILGYTSLHYPDFYFKKNLEMKISQDILDKYQTITDVPVAYIYKELDRKYPNAKFVLTLRDEEDWLKSVSKFFTKEGGSASEGFLIDFYKFIKPSNTRWRRIFLLRYFVYGSYEFNKKKYLQGYKKHNKEVIDYFKNREGKLLVVYLTDEQNKWEKLCAFLKKDIPIFNFPHSNNANPQN